MFKKIILASIGLFFASASLASADIPSGPLDYAPTVLIFAVPILIIVLVCWAIIRSIKKEKENENKIVDDLNNK